MSPQEAAERPWWIEAAQPKGGRPAKDEKPTQNSGEVSGAEERGQRETDARIGKAAGVSHEMG